MKKLGLLVAPFAAFTFLASCNKATEYEYTVRLSDNVKNFLTIDKATVKKGEDFIAKISFIANQSKLVLPQTLTKVVSGNEIVADYTYSPSADYSSADFAISADKIVGDTVISLDIIDVGVDQTEFDDALAFKNDTYMQLTTEKLDKTGATTSYREISPKICSEKLMTLAPEEIESCVREVNGKLEGKTRKTLEERKWHSIEAEEELNRVFVTPQKIGKTLKETVEKAGVDLSYDKFTFDPIIRSYNGHFETKQSKALSSETVVSDVILKFENKKLISFDFQTDGEHIHIASSFTYVEKTLKWPGEFVVDIPDSDYLTISNDTAKEGEDFAATITVGDTSSILPANVVVKFGDTVVDKDSYTYTPDANYKTATFKINGENVNSDIKISFGLSALTEQEFNDAMYFKDVQYLQTCDVCKTWAPFEEEGVIKEVTDTFINEMSPGDICHRVFDIKSYHPYEVYCEVYLQKIVGSNGETYRGVYSYDPKDEGDWYPVEPELCWRWYTNPQKIGESYFGRGMPKYKNFTCEEGSEGVYAGAITDGAQKRTWELKFKDKKLTNVDCTPFAMYDSTKATVTYNEVDIKIPEPGPKHK
ncbi:MAG: hypothetical protein MJ208_01315 [Bacilli bacterium]|nr:hypothetical protein [Bacilli bacterium]